MQGSTQDLFDESDPYARDGQAQGQARSLMTPTISGPEFGSFPRDPDDLEADDRQDNECHLEPARGTNPYCNSFQSYFFGGYTSAEVCTEFVLAVDDHI